MANFFTKLLSFGADKDLKRFERTAAHINEIEPTYTAMSDDDLREQTFRFRERYAHGESLDDMLPEAFATCREMSRRVMGMRHFDVQLIGGIALHEGMIAEMKTGEVVVHGDDVHAVAGDGVQVARERGDERLALACLHLGDHALV